MVGRKLGFNSTQKNGIILLYSADWLCSPTIPLPSSYFPQWESGRAVELYLHRFMRSYDVIFNEPSLTSYLITIDNLLLTTNLLTPNSGVPKGGLGVNPPPRNSEAEPNSEIRGK
jgi:hypothetical protein